MRLFIPQAAVSGTGSAIYAAVVLEKMAPEVQFSV